MYVCINIYVPSVSRYHQNVKLCGTWEALDACKVRPCRVGTIHTFEKSHFWRHMCTFDAPVLEFYMCSQTREFHVWNTVPQAIWLSWWCGHLMVFMNRWDGHGIYESDSLLSDDLDCLYNCYFYLYAVHVNIYVYIYTCKTMYINAEWCNIIQFLHTSIYIYIYISMYLFLAHRYIYMYIYTYS